MTVAATGGSNNFGALHWSRHDRVFFCRASKPVYVMLALAILCVGSAIALGRFDWDAGLFADAATSIGFFLVVAYAARWLGFARLADPLEMVMVMLGLTFFLSFCAVIAASTAAPLADPVLGRIDMALFGIDRNRVVAFVAQSPLAIRAATLIYMSLTWTLPLLGTLLVITGQSDRAWRLLSAIVAALCIAIAMLSICPAYGTPPYAYRFVEILNGVRDGSMRRLDGSVITGLVTFPSIHAAYGVFLAHGFSRIGKWASPLVALNIAMIGSALVVGGHYLIDLVAGCFMAVGLIRLFKA